MEKYHFSGWATRNDLLCADGRTIRKNAFKDNDGQEVPLVWNHAHGDPEAVLGHALLENRDDGVYAYCTFNNTERGKHAKEAVANGDVRSLSIWANKLKQIGNDVIHGTIRELSLVLAGANPGAYIDVVMAHGEAEEDSMLINYDESAIVLYHSDIEQSENEDDVDTDDNDEVEDETESDDEVETDEDVEDETLSHSEEKTGEKSSEDSEDSDDEDDESIGDVLSTLNEKQKLAVAYMLGSVIQDNESVEENEESEGGNNTMKHNVFDSADTTTNEAILSHADQEAIVELAKKPGVGSLKHAMAMYAEEHEELAHGLDLGDAETLEELLPDHKLLNPGAPEILRADNSWVMGVINKVHKSPYSRIRTRYADARIKEAQERLKTLSGKGYNDRSKAKAINNHIQLIGRKTEPTTIYIKDELHRDDIIDITDFDVIAYTWTLMKDNMYETLARTILVGDGREDTDPDKINETNVRPIWKDAESYTHHVDVDIAKAKAELQGSNTSANFGENYIYAEAIITAALYSRETFKGSGTPDLYCAPHLVNVMLLARDLNGRRIYDSKADLARALNVNSIVEIEEFEGLTRTTEGGEEKKLLGLFVNLSDYQLGSTKGGEITKFDDFDIDFNKYKYLMETRLSGALNKLDSAIALEEAVVSDEAAG